jgi:hypothetical protein
MVYRYVIAVAVLSHSMTTNVTRADTPNDIVWVAPPAVNDDIQPFTPRRLMRRTGVVQSIDDRTLVFVATGETTASQIPSDRVVWAEPDFADPETEAAVRTYREGDFKAAIPLLLESVTRRPTVWRAQWLSMHLWQAAYQAERYPATLELVTQIDARPIPAFVVGGLPIHWAGERPSAPALEAARNALALADRPGATKLVAASWLLGQPNDQMAVSTLQTLVLQKERPLVAQLATMLLYRKTPPPELISQKRDWSQKLTKLPMTAQSGPVTLLADRVEAAGNAAEAVELFLTVGLTSTRPHMITPFARTRAISLLERLGQNKDAIRLRGATP